uniref:hAT-like transposase RNase-H fold domain-containing protein n=1 Tax=Hordeum vulgare subsp. vulgare TaxID=112509 RepID=A0A8I6XGF7_HORVV
MIVVDELPFIFVEKEGFRFFMSKACPRLNVPSRTIMYRDIIDLYESEKAMLRKYFIDSRQTVCLTTDTWTSKRQQSYMVLTAHYIDSRWKLRKKIISFVLVDGHKGDDIGKSLEKLLTEWGIERVCTITVDNASSNDTCLAYMKRSLTNRGCTHASSRYLHMRCVAHIVNLVVQDGLKIMCHPVNRIRNAIKFVRASPTRLGVLKKCVQRSKVASKGLINIDVSTRWNSTFVMLNTAEKFERAFEQYALHDPNHKTELEKNALEPKPDTVDQQGPPTQSDWVYVREFKQFLQHFYELTNKVSRTKYITINTFLEEIVDVHFMLGEWNDHVICGDDKIFKCMATKMKEKYEKYWDDPEKMNKYIFIAAMLDPRTKESHFFKDMIEDTYGSTIGNRILTSSHTELVSLFGEYKELYGTSTSSDLASQARASENSSENSLMRSRYNKKRMRVCGEGSRSTYSRMELDKYLAEDTEELSPEFDLLEW